MEHDFILKLALEKRKIRLKGIFLTKSKCYIFNVQDTANNILSHKILFELPAAYKVPVQDTWLNFECVVKFSPKTGALYLANITDVKKMVDVSQGGNLIGKTIANTALQENLDTIVFLKEEDLAIKQRVKHIHLVLKERDRQQYIGKLIRHDKNYRGKKTILVRNSTGAEYLVVSTGTKLDTKLFGELVMFTAIPHEGFLLKVKDVKNVWQ